MIAYPGRRQESSGLVFPEGVNEEMVTWEQVAEEAVAGEKPAPSCCHYWIIETADGPISRGQCQYCHVSRDFKNSVYDMDREEQDATNKESLGQSPATESPVSPPQGPGITPVGIDEPGSSGEAEASELPEVVVA